MGRSDQHRLGSLLYYDFTHEIYSYQDQFPSRFEAVRYQQELYLNVGTARRLSFFAIKLDTIVPALIT